MDFKRYLAVNAQKINEELDLILSDFLNETKKTNIKLLPFALGFIKACQGGKRIRGVLVKLGYEMAGGSGEEILRVGVAIEILHTALLVHDDVIDQSSIRRGQPSLYQALGGSHYGMSQAISLGDIGLYLPIKIISQANFPGEIKIKAINHLSQIIINTGWGQVLDVELPQHKVTIMKLKTAQYTIAGPLQIGAILAGAADELLGRLGLFGENLGIAFQIQDDILDGETTSLNHAKALAYISKGEKLIPQIVKDPKMSTLLEQMAEYLIQRSK